MSIDILADLRAAVLDGEPAEVKQMAQRALAAGLAPLAIVQEGLTAGIREVGEEFQKGKYFLPDLVRGAHSMEAGLEVLEPLLAGNGEARASLGTVILGTVHGDLHSIGKNIVGALLRASGFEVEDLGVNVPTQVFVEKVRESGAGFLGLSALLTTTVHQQEAVITALEDGGLRDRVRVLLGGAPIDKAWADRVGADGYAPDAARAVRVAKELASAS
ncbi:MAG: corrinoid protein [Thermoleophilia bacterium]|nr:corrinoid protein [Thermoleophilia bacterium]